MISESQNNNDNAETIYEDEIDLKPLLKILKINKKTISIITILSFLVGFSIRFFSKRQWSGEFEVVLRNQPSLTELASRNKNQISALSLLGRSSTQLKTQISILQSPSVLLEIFEFVKAQKFNEKNISELRFRDWKKQLKFDNPKETSVLKVSYVDTDKLLINPVLKKISQAYQQYSGKDRRRQIELGKQFFISQLELYRSKSSESLDKAQEFANKYNLIILSGDPTSILDSTKSENFNFPSFNINIETERIKARNKIKVIDKQIEKVNSYNNESSEIIYLGSSLEGGIDVIDLMKSIEMEINDAKRTYKKGDRAIKDLLFKRKNLIKTTKEITLTSLKGMRDKAKARLEATERPEGVFIEYRQLLDIAARDKFTLQKLENDFRVLSLEEQRLQDPWELITKPTLLPNPVPRNTIFYSLLTGLFGFIGSSFYLIVKDYRKGLIRSFAEIKSIVSCSYHEYLLKDNQSKWYETLNFFLKKTFIKSSDDLAFYIVGDINKLEIKEILNCIKKIKPDYELKIINNLTEIFNYSSFVIITSVGTTNKNELKDLSRKLLQLNKSITSTLSILDFL